MSLWASATAWVGVLLLASPCASPLGSFAALRGLERWQALSKPFHASCIASQSSASGWGLARRLLRMERPGTTPGSCSSSNADCTASAVSSSRWGGANGATAPAAGGGGGEDADTPLGVVHEGACDVRRAAVGGSARGVTQRGSDPQCSVRSEPREDGQ